MKRRVRVHLRRWVVLALGAGLLGAAREPVRATVTFQVNAGYLRVNATTAMNSATSPGGALLLLVAAGGNSDTTFTNTLSAGQYVAGGDVILDAFSFNAFNGTSSDGTGKATQNGLSGLTLPAGVSVGTPVELRWFPAITLTQYNNSATPAAGSSYGVYTPSLYNLSTNPTPDGGSAWTVPGNGSTATLNFYTTDHTSPTGTQAPAEGYASLAVVPEPSAAVLLGTGVLGLAAWRRGRSRV